MIGLRTSLRSHGVGGSPEGLLGQKKKKTGLTPPSCFASPVAVRLAVWFAVSSVRPGFKPPKAVTYEGFGSMFLFFG